MRTRLIQTFILLILSSISAQTIETISGDFVKEITQGKRPTESVEGRFYLKTPNLILIHIQKPLEQLCTLYGDTIILYYPKENKMFKIKATNPFLTYIPNTPYAININVDLLKLGFLFLKKAQIADTVFSYWTPKDNSSVMTIIIGKIGNKLMSINIVDKKGQFVKVLYSNHIKHDNIDIPSDILSMQSALSDTLFEHYIYKNIYVNESLPDSIFKFSIPKDAEIRNVLWQ